MQKINHFVKLLMIEFIGTFWLVFVCTSAMFIPYQGKGLPQSGVALVCALAIIVVVRVFGPICCGHFNPAVTIGLALCKRFAGKQIMPYILVQCLGAISASTLQMTLLGKAKTSLAVTYPTGGVVQSFLMESVLTGVLVFAILVIISTDKLKPFAGMVMGLVVAIAIIVGGNVSGASLNPARSLGPALISLKLEYLWLYWVAPITGGFLAYLGGVLLMPQRLTREVIL